MQRITYQSPAKGGFSDIRLRIILFTFLTLGLFLTPALGAVTAFSVVIIFGVFIARKIAKFQSTNSRSIWRHRQEMDKLYHNSKDAEFIARRLADLDRKDAREKAKSAETITINSKKLALN
ncbi:MAG: hypothetical protein WCQ49_01760 [Candidatus Saccharibacteria bacterium]